MVMLKNLERFLEQAQYDPSVSFKSLQDWESSLIRQLNVQALKYQYATLYGQLVTEWLSEEQVAAPTDNASEKSDDFEDVNIRKEERDAGRAEWERLVFDPFETDQMAIAEYLRRLFGNSGANKQAIKALDALRKDVGDFQASLTGPDQFNAAVLRWTIDGLLASGLLTEEKSAPLKDFLASPVILGEVADVLNMRMAAIDNWSWEIEGLSVQQRRHVTGNYHIYIDEDLLQAIFLQFIGMKWCVFFKHAFTRFLEFDGAWSSMRPVSQIEEKRREYFLGPQSKEHSVQSKRQRLYKSIYFMSQLPDSEYQGYSAVEGDEEADYDSRTERLGIQSAQSSLIRRAQQMHKQNNQAETLQVAAQQARPAQAMSQFQSQTQLRPRSLPTNLNLEDEVDKPKSPMEKKQFLLHLLSTEISVNTRLHGEFTCTRSEFASWSPSLPHSTIYSVLSFFGLSEKWLGFFRKFLEAPLRFVQDGASAQTKTRKRGVPGAHALSVICGEVILFCMDYAVNQHANGAQLYRMHDDFWIWSPSHQTVVKAWAAINDFAGTIGVSLNGGKTGTVRIMGDKGEPEMIDPSLPKGEIRWGFLHLDPASSRFVIDQTMVDKHIEELQVQLHDKKSIFSWIQAWNTYAGRFFTSNFGKPANCFGTEHVDSMLASLERIQRRIFSDTNVVQYLKDTLRNRFGISDIPDGYLYFPTSLGGLELHNPFIGLLQLRDSVYEHPASALDDLVDAEAEFYRRCKSAFENEQVARYENKDPKFVPEDGLEFMSFEEYTRYREEYEGELFSIFVELLQQPKAQTVDLNHSDSLSLKRYPNMADGYWRWVAQLYGPDMTERFGGLNIVDAGLLPVGMVNLYRSGRVKRQG